MAFGVVKAFLNLASGLLADRFTRKAVLVAGWIFGLPVPFMLGMGPFVDVDCRGECVARHQPGPRLVDDGEHENRPRRASATRSRDGAQRSRRLRHAGATALITGYVAAAYGLRPEPFYIGIVYRARAAALRPSCSRYAPHARLEPQARCANRPGPHSRVFAETSWRNTTLFSVSQAGLVNNLNDGMSWGVFPFLFVANGVRLADVGLIKAVYPVIWGAGQIFTGWLADRVGRKPLIVWGMIVQAAGHAVIGLGLAAPLAAGLAGSVLLGLGTAMVYPAMLAAVGDVAHPIWRATSLGVYRFWRDLGMRSVR